MDIQLIYRNISNGDKKAVKYVLKRQNIKKNILEFDFGTEKHLLLLHGYRSKGKIIVWTELVRLPIGETSGIDEEKFSLIDAYQIDTHIKNLANLFLAIHEVTPDFVCEECAGWRDCGDS
jgi:hypothetical protein